MAYFTYTPLTANAVARAADVNSRFQGVVTAFDLLPDATTMKLVVRTLVAAGGTANALTVTNTPPITAYATGQRITFIAPETNTGAVTINVDGVGIVALTTQNGAALTAGSVSAGSLYDAIYTGGSFRLTSLSPTTLLSYQATALAAATEAEDSADDAEAAASTATAAASAASSSASAAAGSASAAGTSATNAASSASAAAASAATVDTTNFMALTGAQTAAGLKTFSNGIVINGQTLDGLTAAGVTLTEAADAAAQRVALNVDDVGIAFAIGDGASVITTGVKGAIPVPFPMTVTSIQIVSTNGTSGSIVVDVKRATYAGLPTFSSISGTEKPTISSSTKNTDTSLTSFTTSLAQGDWLQFVVDSVTSLTAVTVVLYGTRAG